jgi:hypothetical protein
LGAGVTSVDLAVNWFGRRGNSVAFSNERVTNKNFGLRAIRYVRVEKGLTSTNGSKYDEPQQTSMNLGGFDNGSGHRGI